MTPFTDLALGAKFKYPGQKRIWVKIGYDEIAEWDEKMKDCGWTAQQICSFCESDNDVFGVVEVL